MFCLFSDHPYIPPGPTKGGSTKINASLLLQQIEAANKQPPVGALAGRRMGDQEWNRHPDKNVQDANNQIPQDANNFVNLNIPAKGAPDDSVDAKARREWNKPFVDSRLGDSVDKPVDNNGYVTVNVGKQNADGGNFVKPVDNENRFIDNSDKDTQHYNNADNAFNNDNNDRFNNGDSDKFNNDDNDRFNNADNAFNADNSIRRERFQDGGYNENQDGGFNQGGRVNGEFDRGFQEDSPYNNKRQRRKIPTAPPRPRLEARSEVEWFEEYRQYALKASVDLRLRIRHAPIPLAGSPWPLPQEYQPARTQFRIRPAHFVFHATAESCDILQFGFERAQKNTFGDAAETEEVESGGFGLFGRGEKEDGAEMRELMQLNVTLHTPCNDDSLPHLDMSEKCKYARLCQLSINS